MPIRQWGDNALGTNEHRSFGYYNWTLSPRKKGQLQLQSNAHVRNTGRVFRTITGPGLQLRGASRGLDFLEPYAYSRLHANLYAQAYGLFRSKLYDGSASLGMTAATYKQSRDMIVARSKQVVREHNEFMARLGRGVIKPRNVANAALEVLFGWKPLAQDVFNAAYKVIQKADSYQFVKVKRDTTFSYGSWPPKWGTSLTGGSKCDGVMSVGLSARVLIKNPNIWLLERAGLLNPAAVAWDAVPWSFVVNMFVNTGQLVNSITDFVGLEFDGALETIKFKGTYSYGIGWIGPNQHSESHWFNDQKYQNPTSLPTPSLVLKVPQANWELAVIASSLMVQRTQGLAALIRAAKAGKLRYTE